MFGGAPTTQAALLSKRVINPLTIYGLNLRWWFDTQDLSTMFSDYALTPATVGSAMALQWDKAKHGFGSDIKSTGVPYLTGAATAATYNTSTGAGTAVRVDGGNYSGVDFTGDTIGRPYLVDVENTGAAAFSVRDGVSVMVNINAGQRKTVFVQAIATSVRILPDVNGTSIAFTVHSVKEVLGTPRYQATSAQRPILGRHPKGGRRNLLTYTEDFSNAAWLFFNVSGTATRVGNALTFGASGIDRITQVGKTVTAEPYTASITLSGTGSVRLYLIDGAGSTGTPTSISLTSTPTVYTMTRTFASGGTGGGIGIYNNAAGTPSTVTLASAQLEPGSTATAYQAVTTTYDCTEAGVADCYFPQADGFDDGMVTPALDLSGTDKIGVFTAVRKLSDAAIATVVEFTTSTGDNNGSFRMTAPNTAGANYAFTSRGTTARLAGYTDAAVAAPHTAVLTGLGDIGGDLITLRVNGVQVAQTTSDQGAGNYTNSILYFFRRGGTTLPFNGLEYGNFGVDVLPSITQIDSSERYQNNYVGAYL